MAFKAEEKTISKLLNDVVYEIPRNQRKYVWKDENWNDLFNDVIFASENNKAHFLGSIVLKEELKINALDHYTIIDGQQRIMTITICLAAIMLHFKNLNLKNDFDGTKKYLQSTDTKNQARLVFETDYHLSLPRIIEKIFNNIEKSPFRTSLSYLSDCIIDKKRDKIVSDCFVYFFSEINKRIVENPTKSPQEIISSIRDAILNMTYISIIATTEEDSYTIFEILNARGQTLDDHELLKNYIMRYYEPVSSRDRAKSLWDNMEVRLQKSMKVFIEHYAPHKYAAPKDMRTEPYKLITKSTKDVKNLIEDLTLKSNYYSLILNPKINDDDKETCSMIECRIFSFLKAKRITQFRPVLLSLIHQKDCNNMTEDEYNNVLNFLFKFLICYVFVGSERTNRLSDIVQKYAPLIENNYSRQEIDGFVSSLKSKIPDKTWFTTLFQNIGYSKNGLLNDSREKEKAQTVLTILEQYFRGDEYEGEFTIEHILPDSTSEEHARIGNLLPLEEHLNRRCDNLPLEEKMNVYRESKFLSVKRFVERYENNIAKFDISKRTASIGIIFYDDILRLNSLKTL